ncbi:archaetidylserine decarboxylase [Porticoccus sp. W117]|uniref:archaetidylserine decarboxylase n=1 Tax=Porticoccus sp. W117 TaxID=3054777 RepID=UPI0025985B06|nr:archaetidylserine decarboxylase [Porticoccus sp. W117]MDM3871552.1 archaetidylserine decarboxylase [Porticoccus sp. W117]
MKNLPGELFAALQRLLPQHSLSRLIAKLADSETPWLKRWLIERFVAAYGINVEEALEQDLDKYASFNAFFTRQLQAEARPLDSASNTITSPADGAISQIGYLQGDQLIQAKGKTFSANTLLGCEQDANLFEQGAFTTIYLSPKDYHRVHMPVDGQLLHSRYIPGHLFSVNKATTTHIPGLFARNERLVCLFQTPAGKVAIVLVGAMLVAGIGTVWQGQYAPNPRTVVEQTFDGETEVVLSKGDELGHFNFGSTVIMLFEKDAMHWHQQLGQGEEVKMGEALGLTA